jgi:hypothetical protein
MNWFKSLFHKCRFHLSGVRLGKMKPEPECDHVYIETGMMVWYYYCPCGNFKIILNNEVSINGKMNLDAATASGTPARGYIEKHIYESISEYYDILKDLQK